MEMHLKMLSAKVGAILPSLSGLTLSQNEYEDIWMWRHTFVNVHMLSITDMCIEEIMKNILRYMTHWNW